LIQYYREAGVLIEINGVGQLSQVYERTIAEIQKIAAAETI
jgi:hypothetical protein